MLDISLPVTDQCLHPKNEDSHNAQTKGTHYKSMVKSVHKGRWLHLLVNSQYCKLSVRSKKHFRVMNQFENLESVKVCFWLTGFLHKGQRIINVMFSLENVNNAIYKALQTHYIIKETSHPQINGTGERCHLLFLKTMSRRCVITVQNIQKSLIALFRTVCHYAYSSREYDILKSRRNTWIVLQKSSKCNVCKHCLVHYIYRQPYAQFQIYSNTC